MHIEDSYEGAVRRLARLSNGGVDLLPSRRDDQEAAMRERMRDLERLATLSTDENERLERELASARETIRHLQEQLTAADRQRLRDLVEPPPPEQRRSFLPYLAALAVAGLVVAAGIALEPWQYAAHAQELVRRRVVHPWAVPVDAAPPAPTRTVVPAVPAPAVVAAAVVPEPPTTPKKHTAKHRSKPHRHAAPQKPAKPASKDSDPLLGL